nr:uncharacterized protein LOC112937500 isoform X1 [Oryza sativa Japonica Group]
MGWERTRGAPAPKHCDLRRGYQIKASWLQAKGSKSKHFIFQEKKFNSNLRYRSMVNVAIFECDSVRIVNLDQLWQAQLLQNVLGVLKEALHQLQQTESVKLLAAS